MHERYDAIIIGGGPAGALSALLLARQGWRLALIEKRDRNQPKTCGHCLDARALPLLERAGLLQRVRRIAVGTSRCAHIHCANAAPVRWAMSRNETGASLLVQRSEFDQLLLDQARSAGVDVLQSAAARILSMTPGDCRVSARGRTFEASLLIGADGLRSTVARACGLHDRRSSGGKYGFAFQTMSTVADSLERDVTHMFILGGGYLGVVHHGSESLHIAALVDRQINDGDCSPTVFVKRAVCMFPILSDLADARWRSFTATGPMPSHARSVATTSVALVGDAAGYLEPFTGEGMTWAMQSAEVLASVTAPLTPGAWSKQAAAAYRSRWRQFIARRQRFCRTLAWALERPAMLRPLLAFTRHRPDLARRVAQKVLAA